MNSKEEDPNERYEYWEPTAAYLNLQKYKLIIFEWNALFHQTTGKALPGVADSLFLLNNFYIGKGKQRLKLCVSKDCPPSSNSTKTSLKVKSEPTADEWKSLQEVLSTKGSKNGPTFTQRSTCFAMSSDVRKPSNLVIEYFKKEVGGCKNFFKNDMVQNWPKTETLLVGATWRDFSASSRSNTDFTWCSHFFGGLSGNSFWFPSSIQLNFEKKWYRSEKATVFNIKSKALVQVIWDDLEYDPANSDNEISKFYAMAVNTSLCANAAKQEILDELGLQNKFVGLSKMKLYYQNRSKSSNMEGWCTWPSDAGVTKVVKASGNDNPLKVLLCTNESLFTGGDKVEEFISQRAESIKKGYQESFDKIRSTLDSEDGNWNVSDDIMSRFDTEYLSATEDDSMILGLTENNKQREGINTLLRNGIIGYNSDGKYDNYPEIRRIKVNFKSNGLIVNDTHRGKHNIGKKTVSYPYKILKKQAISFEKNRNGEKVQFGEAMGDLCKLYKVMLQLKDGKKLSIGFISKDEREIAFRALSFYFSNSPLLLEENHRLVRKSLNAAAKEEEVVAQKITIAFIQSKLQADASNKSGEDELSRASSTLPFDVLDETDLSHQTAVKNRVLASLENDVENYTFPSISEKIMQEIMQASTSKLSKHDADPVATPVKKKVDVIEYKAEVPEAEEEDKTEEKLAEALAFLKKGFWGYKHKRNKGKKLTKKYFFINESKGILFFADKELHGAAKESHADKGIILGEITKLVHGKELDPKNLWHRDWKCCLSIGGFFSANVTNIEFAKEEECLQVYHALQYFLFLNEGDTIEDNIIYSENNKIEGIVDEIVLGDSDHTILKNKFVKFDHGAITIYNLGNSNKLGSSPKHVFQVEHDTKVKTRETDHNLRQNEFKVEFQFGDLLVDKLFLVPETVTFSLSDKKAKDDWYEKITTVAGNLKVEKEANHMLIQHGKNRYYDKLKDIDPELRKVTSKQGTFFGNIFNKKE